MISLLLQKWQHVAGHQLTNMLHYINSRIVFDSFTGLNPFLLLRGNKELN
jgi:hypothetical protein